eukprot:CAMPEP_0114252730 /NCGR_PEP_ID=MMETSP0058-20121206/15999_1 /TAXON_ID=36894 /ORGANISM="Pyramimonas parkeae, CCMP726" /LENGTH=127 /DNA_ID=CAMNT_0001366697 /DNA_START=69 /DNA_END=452 /DNA_ORIENTATION=+
MIANPALKGMRGSTLTGRKVSVSSRAVAPVARAPLAVSAMAKKYKVAPGDSVYSIAQKYGITTDDIVAANTADFANGLTTIYPEQELSIPTKGSTGIMGQVFSIKGAFVLALVLAAVFYRTNETKDQ